ncbi:MAG: T9SS type A sorting domain-containing protein [Bacteroidia bacterium]
MKKFLLFLFLHLSLITVAQTFDWAKRINYWGDDLATDANKNVYSFNKFNLTEDVDPGPGVYSLTPIGGWDVCLTKLDSMGNLLSVIRYGSTGDEAAKNITIDYATGNIYLLGSFTGTIDFDPGPGVVNLTSASTSMFLLQFDSSLNLIWARTISASSRGLTVDESGIYLFGSFNGLVDFDPGAGTSTLSSGAGTDCFITKWTTAGNFSWVKRFDGSMSAWNDAVCLDSLNNIYIAGQYMSTYDFDPGPGVYNMTASSYDNFLVKLDSSGNFVYAKTLTSSGSSTVDDLRYDPSGKIILLLTHNGTIDADLGPGTTTLTAGVTYATAVIKYDLNANLLNPISINGGNWITGVSLELDQWGNMYIGGNFKATVDLNPGPGVNNIVGGSTTDEVFYILKLDAMGNYIWAFGFGTTAGAVLNRIHLAPTNELYMTGWYDTPTDFDPGPGTSILGPTGGFVMKFRPDLCYNTAFIIDSVVNVGCLGYGTIATHVENGLAPYLYEWDALPPSTDSVMNFSSAGIHSIKVTDGNGCVDSTMILQGGITDTAGFDLKVDISIPSLRQGIPTTVFINGYNNACTPVSGYMRVALDSYLNVNTVFPPADSVSGTNVFMWNFNNFKYDSGMLTPEIHITPSISTPDDYVACITASMFPLAGDNNAADNSKTRCRMITNSHDPNIIDVDPVGNCMPHYVADTQMLTYSIQFQNNGSADAINIYVLDTLDPKLDINTVHVTVNSHPMVTEILPGNVLKFRYDNIMLPDSASDEPGSHGYIIYEVYPLNGTPNGAVIENFAGIYFDFNPPVYTNTVFNTINDGTYFAPVTTTTVMGGTITANENGMIYQWINCITGDSIAGANSQNYTPVQNGYYAVIISDGCDADTSACVAMLTTGVNQNSNCSFSFFPNPATNNVTVITPSEMKIRILNVLGEEMLEQRVNGETTIDISSFASGIYFIQPDHGKVLRLTKQ